MLLSFFTLINIIGYTYYCIMICDINVLLKYLLNNLKTFHNS